MDLQIEQRESEGIIILDLKGRLVLGPQDSALRQRLQNLLESGHSKVILNLKHVSEMDTSTLGTLVYFLTTFRDAGGRLVLLHLSPAHTEMANIVKLNTAFEIYDDEVGAVNSFFPERVVPHYDILEFIEDLERREDAGHGEEKRSDEARRESQKLPK